MTIMGVSVIHSLHVFGHNKKSKNGSYILTIQQVPKPQMWAKALKNLELH